MAVLMGKYMHNNNSIPAYNMIIIQLLKEDYMAKNGKHQ